MKTAECFVGNCILVTSQVLDEHGAVDTLHSGCSYGHNLTAANEALWTLDVYAHSSVDDARQIAFVAQRQSREWSFRVTLAPNREGTRSEILTCLKRKAGRDAVRTEVRTNNNLSDLLSLDLKIV